MIALPTDAEPVVVVEGDCLATLRALPSASIDAVVSDPPYGITNERYDSASAWVFDPAYWSELARVCGPNAGSLSFGHTSTYHRMATAAEAGGWKVRQMWAWVYRDGMITSSYPKDGFDRLAPAMDPILYATRGKVLLNVEREGAGDWTRTRGGCGLSGRSNGNTAANDGTGRYPRAVVSDGCGGFEYFALPRAGRYRTTAHPNEKPLPLIRWLVAKLPGAVILDPFAGSGTTGEAALIEGRRAVLIEREPTYAAIARRRVADALGSGLLAGSP